MSSTGIGSLLALIVWVAIVLMFARVILEWVQMLARSWRPSGAVAVLCEAIYSVTDPPIRAVRSVLPPIRIGNVMLDLATLVVIITLYILLNIIYAIF